MSLSLEDRQAFAKRFLLEALAAIGDEHCFEDVTFEPGTDFVWMPKSIWNDLFDAVLIQDFRIPGHFGLTQHGWHHALKLAGDWESPALRDRCVSLVAALKGAVDGRHDDIAIDTAEIATSAGLPLGWTKSAIKSRGPPRFAFGAAFRLPGEGAEGPATRSGGRASGC